MLPRNRAQLHILAALFAVLLLAQIDQPFPGMAWMQHSPTLLLILAAPWLLRRWPLSTRNVALIALFFTLHTLGGRYIYSYVPYDDWTRALFGTGIGEALGWQRNHYDRLIHFLSGLLLVPPFAEWLRRHRRRPHRQALTGAVGIVIAIGAGYEIFEWLLTLVMGGNAERYNGQQGDMWDAQKDMALAVAGALIAAVILGYRRR
ncbi:MAG: DUF2238 domain-containing protein [Pacificimonas sp.]